MQREAATGSGLDIRITAGLQNEAGGSEVEGSASGMPGFTVVMGSSTKHQEKRVPT